MVVMIGSDHVDPRNNLVDNQDMNSIANPDTEARSRLESVVALISSGRNDAQSRDAACADMDRIREQVRRRHGVLDVGVPAIRELRGELPTA